MNRHPDRPYRIGLFTTSIEFGGLDEVVINLIDNLDPAYFSIIPILSVHENGNNTVLRHLKKSPLESYRITTNKLGITYLNPVRNLWQAYSIFRNCRLDLLHTHGYRADILGYVVAKSLGLPILSTCHGFIENDIKLKAYNRMDKFFLKYFDRVIAVSKDIGDSLKVAGVKKSRLRIIPNGISRTYDPENYRECRLLKRNLLRLENHDFVLGYVGRLSREKGLNYLIKAISSLLDDRIPVKLVILGDGSQRQELELLSKQSGTDTSIFFLGFRKDVQSWLPIMDVFVLPSLTEGTPLALLEAMSFGIPVVASSVGGIPDMVESGLNGILVKPGSAGEIKDAIYNLYHAPDYKNKIGKSARKGVESRYNLQDWIRSMENEYLTVIRGG